MDIKKILLTGSTVAAMAFVAACSDDSSSGPKNEEPASSATIDQPGSSDATTPTSIFQQRERTGRAPFFVDGRQRDEHGHHRSHVQRPRCF